MAKVSIPESTTPSTLEEVGDNSQSSCPAPARGQLSCIKADSLHQENIPVASHPDSPHNSALDLSPGRKDSHKETRGEEQQETAGARLQEQKLTVDDARDPNLMPVQRSQSTSNLTTLLSHKLSTAFANSTVIHRSSLRPRPSVQAVQCAQAVDVPLSQQGDNTVDSSNLSTTLSGGSCWSSDPNSTPPTSDDSPTSDSLKSQFWNTNGNEDPSQQDHQRPDHATLNTSPSIITVEAAANAKVFFESYFNSVFSRVDARFQRHHELEEYIYSLPFSAEEQVMIWKNWIAQEREYLRQYRVLKSRCHDSRHEETVSIANYEAVKVLGHGSFGVVRLVREKTNEHSNHETEEHDSPLLERSGVRTDARSSPALDRSRPSSRKYTSGVYAMKVIRKSEMLRTSQEGHLRAERDFLVASAKSRWVVPLIASFQDSQNLYLVMEYMVGGDFLGLLIRQGILPERATRWYIAEMILCVEEAHKLLWIHRDIKPDNFLISASGHLRIADFGLAFDGHWSHDQGYYYDHRYSLIKKLGIQIDGDAIDQKDEEEAKKTPKAAPGSPRFAITDELREEPPRTGLLGWRDKYQRRRFARSVVGTSQYMAPEVVRGRSYDGRCDWWSIGIILYEVSTPKQRTQRRFV